MRTGELAARVTALENKGARFSRCSFYDKLILPSAINICPVIYDESGEAGNSAMPLVLNA